MAMSGKQALLLGVLVAAFLAVAAEGSVTVYNPAKTVVTVKVKGWDEMEFNMDMDMMTLDITGKEQKIEFKSLTTGAVLEDTAIDGDKFVLIPDLSGGISLALKVQGHD